MKVLVADAVSAAGLSALRDRGLEADVRPGLSEDELCRAIPEYDALIVRSATRATRRVIEAGHKLRIIGRAGVGVDNIDEEAATARGIIVTNTPTGNTVSATEHTFALLLALVRKVPEAAASLRRGAWERSAFAGTELAGKTIGIIGLGRIGREVAARARAFQMRVLAHDPFVAAELAKDLGVELVPTERLLAESDVVTLHTPLTAQTERIIGVGELAKMKKGARLLNVARGGLVDEAALAAALREGRLAGAAFDVFESEPPGKSPLFELPTFLGTPHLGASTVEAQEKVALQVATQVADFLLDGTISNAINLAVPPHPALLPFIELATGMAQFAAQLAAGQPEELDVECAGEFTRHDAQPVAVAALAGLLSRSSDERVTLVNAERRAKEQGVRFVRSQSPTAQDYTSLVGLTLRTNAGDVTVRGTHLAKLGPRIVEVQGLEVEFKPHGRFLVVEHTDTPGTIAKISGVLGRANINIAQMVVGRLAPRGQAISILRVDDPIPAPLVEEIRKTLGVPHVRSVHVPRAREEVLPRGRINAKPQSP